MNSKVIMIVDDSDSVRKFVMFALRADGYQVVIARDGMEALEMFPRQNVDLLITDVNMPNLDGFELIRTLRENEKYTDLPIIVLSSLDDKYEMEKGKEAGADSYLVKPFDPARIQYEVSKYLN